MATQADANLLSKIAFEMNSDMPVEAWLKGDGSFWVREQGHELRKATNEEILKYLYKAIIHTNRMVNVL